MPLLVGVAMIFLAIVLALIAISIAVLNPLAGFIVGLILWGTWRWASPKKPKNIDKIGATEPHRPPPMDE